MKKLSLRQLLLLVSLILPLGCIEFTPDATGGSSEETSASDSNEFTEPTSLETEESGGYDAEDEEPLFGLDSMEQYEEDGEVEDPTVSEEEETAAEADPEAQVYLIRIVWGNLQLNGRDDRDREEIDGDWIDWTGSLSFNGDGDLLL